MRLTLINQFYTPDISPTAHLCASLAEHRAAMGDEVTVLTSRTGYALKIQAAVGQEDFKDCRQPRRLHVRRLWSTRFGSRSNFGRLSDWTTFYLPAFWAAATMPRQDVVIALTTPPFIALAGWLHKLIHPSARLILWNMDVYPEALERTNLVKPDSIISRLLRSANRAIFRRLDHLVTLDSAMADLLLSQYEPPRRPLAHTTIPNWESLAMFPGNPSRDTGFQSVPGASEREISHVSELHARQARVENPWHESVLEPSPDPSQTPEGYSDFVGSAPPTALLRTEVSVRDADNAQIANENSAALNADEKLVVLYLGNAGYGHEFQTLFDAAEQLRDEPVTFLFIGGGALRPWMAGQVEVRKLSNIVLRDYVSKDQTPRVMSQADCALITLENAMLGVMSPSKLHANLAMGLPVIYVGPRGSNVDEAINRFGCGISLRPGQATQMADFVRALIADRGKIAQLRNSARTAFEQAHCDRRALPLFDRVIESALHGRESTGTDLSGLAAESQPPAPASIHDR